MWWGKGLWLPCLPPIGGCPGGPLRGGGGGGIFGAPVGGMDGPRPIMLGGLPGGGPQPPVIRLPLPKLFGPRWGIPPLPTGPLIGGGPRIGMPLEEGAPRPGGPLPIMGPGGGPGPLPGWNAGRGPPRPRNRPG